MICIVIECFKAMSGPLNPRPNRITLLRSSPNSMVGVEMIKECAPATALRCQKKETKKNNDGDIDLFANKDCHRHKETHQHQKEFSTG